MATSGEQFLKTIKKRQIDLCVTNRELREAVGWSESTQRRRYQTPDEITLGEAYIIANYLSINERREQ